jgi:hypothetical protein
LDSAQTYTLVAGAKGYATDRPAYDWPTDLDKDAVLRAGRAFGAVIWLREEGSQTLTCLESLRDAYFWRHWSKRAETRPLIHDPGAWALAGMPPEFLEDSRDSLVMIVSADSTEAAIGPNFLQLFIPGYREVVVEYHARPLEFGIESVECVLVKEADVWSDVSIRCDGVGQELLAELKRLQRTEVPCTLVLTRPSDLEGVRSDRIPFNLSLDGVSKIEGVPLLPCEASLMTVDGVFSAPLGNLVDHADDVAGRGGVVELAVDLSRVGALVLNLETENNEVWRTRVTLSTSDRPGQRSPDGKVRRTNTHLMNLDEPPFVIPLLPEGNHWLSVKSPKVRRAGDGEPDLVAAIVGGRVSRLELEVVPSDVGSGR